MAWLEASKCLGIVIFSLFLVASCERTKDKMYKSLSGAFCFKRLTADQEYGCTSSRSGDTGVLHFILKDADLGWLMEKADAGPYVVVLSFDYFNSKTLFQLKNSGKISGLVLTANKTAVSYSPDDTCPNRKSGLPDQCDERNVWNKAGESLLFINWGFPIIYMDSADAVEFLYECYKEHNAHDLEDQAARSLCSIELVSHMFAAVDSQTCIRRSNMIYNLTPTKFCDPLGDFSIYLPVFPRIGKPEEERKVILVVARLDGNSLFDGLVPGAASPVSGIVTLLTTAHYLSRMNNSITDVAKPDTNVIFVLLNGESYDYIGSSRIIYDMQQDAFPNREDPTYLHSPLLKLKNIGMIVELDQITNRKIVYHSKSSPQLDMAKSFIQALQEESSALNVNVKPSEENLLPPSSVQPFLKADKDIEGFVLGSYDREYSTKFYHSILDTSDKLNYTYLNGSDPESSTVQSALADTSLTIAKALFRVLFKDKQIPKDVKADAQMVDELLHCYLETMNCDLFRKATFQPKLPDRPPSLYVGVNGTNTTITMFTGSTLALLTGTEIDFNQSSCLNNETDRIYQYLWMNSLTPENATGVCIKTAMSYYLALSPAFDIEDYDWNSNNYSSWTESVWQSMSARVFLKPSKQHEILTISLGLLVLILSFVVVYFINNKANVLFNHQVLGAGGC